MIPGISRQTQDFFKVINKKEGLAAPSKYLPVSGDFI